MAAVFKNIFFLVFASEGQNSIIECLPLEKPNESKEVDANDNSLQNSQIDDGSSDEDRSSICPAGEAAAGFSLTTSRYYSFNYCSFLRYSCI